MTHTVDTLMALAQQWVKARTAGDGGSAQQDALQLALEAALKPDPGQSEPIAWLSIDSIGERYLCFSKPRDNDQAQALYAAPRSSAELLYTALQDAPAPTEPVYGNAKTSAGLIYDGLVDYIIKFHFVAPKDTP